MISALWFEELYDRSSSLSVVETFYASLLSAAAFRVILVCTNTSGFVLKEVSQTLDSAIDPYSLF